MTTAVCPFELEIKNSKYIIGDYCELKINVLDSGDDRITVRIIGLAYLFLVNESDISNVIVGDFFLPMFDYSNFMIGAGGDKCQLLTLSVKTIDKKLQDKRDYDRCQCCVCF